MAPPVHVRAVVGGSDVALALSVKNDKNTSFFSITKAWTTDEEIFPFFTAIQNDITKPIFFSTLCSASNVYCPLLLNQTEDLKVFC